MRARIKLTLVAAMAATLMAIMVANASANKISISHGNLLRIEWSSMELSAVGITAVRCALTLEGSFHSTTLSKIERVLVGYVTHASIKNNPCITGSVTVLSETLPWHINYRGFRGILPNITGGIMLVLGSSFRVKNVITGGCLARATTEWPNQAIIEEFEESGEGTRVFKKVRIDEAARLLCVGVEGGSSLTGNLRDIGALREVEGGTPGSQNVAIKLI